MFGNALTVWENPPTLRRCSVGQFSFVRRCTEPACAELVEPVEVGARGDSDIESLGGRPPLFALILFFIFSCSACFYFSYLSAWTTQF